VIWRGIFGMICIRTSVSTEKSVPKIVDDDKIAVAMYVMHKMELLLSSEPRKSRLSAPSSEDGAGGGTDRAQDRGSPDGDRGFESCSLQGRVRCEPDFGRPGHRLDARWS
jgi:hypothetical protein